MVPKQESSESLLTEILSMVQKLNKNVINFKKELDTIKGRIDVLNTKIDTIVKAAFINSDLDNHLKSHVKKSWFLRK